MASIITGYIALSLVGAACAAARSTGCGTPHNFIGSTGEFSFESSGGTRTYRIHLPSDYDMDTPMPLIIAYHGAGSSPKTFEAETGFSDDDVNGDMMTVYPAGIDSTWQGPSYADPSVSDKVFTTDLVNRIKANYCVDSSRVYAVGHSNGGGFVGTLACSPGHGGQFAAFAANSGAFYTDVEGDETCNPARSPLPIMESHGTADEAIPYDGGKGSGGELPPVPDWLYRWAMRNRCGEPSEVQVADYVKEETWDCGGGGKGTDRHVKVEGMGHVYPGPEADQAVNITPMILEWLRGQSLPRN